VASSDDAMRGLDADAFIDHIEEFVTGRRGSGGERVLATVPFSDIVAPPSEPRRSVMRDLVGGSGLVFVYRGEYALKGVPDAWQLFALEP
jgi:hypothetical protein